MLMLLVVAVAWGAIPLLVREDVPASQLVAARVWLGGGALAAYLAVRGGFRWPRIDGGRLVAIGVLRAAHWATFFLAIKATTVAVALAVLYLGPIGAAVAAPRLLRDRPPPAAYAGLLVAFVGVLLVVQPGGSGGGATVTGVAWAAVSAMLLGTLMLAAKPAADRHGGLVVASSELLVAAVVLSPWAVAAAGQAGRFWWQFLVLGVGLTGIAGALYWTAMGRLPVVAVSVLMHLEPASAAIWALVVLHEQPGVVAWIGIAAVITGGIMAVSRLAEEEAPRAIAPV